MHRPSLMASLLPLVLVVAMACGEGPSNVVENTPPSVTVVSPAPNSFFEGGDELTIEITGSDGQDGALEGDALSWWVILHHDTHVHPYLPPANGATGSAPVARTGHVDTNIFLRVYARAVDSEGLELPRFSGRVNTEF